MSYDAISPIDGRYSREAAPLGRYFSDRALMEARVAVELRYLSLLVRRGVAPSTKVPRIGADMVALERLEEELGHDVKAVELYVRRRLLRSAARKLAPFVHLGMTSEDTNSLSYAMLQKAAIDEVLIPAYSSLAGSVADLAVKEASSAMVARTHGMPAVPTTFGKEMAVFGYRLAERVSRLRELRPMAKFSGAVGTYASFALLADLDWPAELAKFVEGFGVEAAPYSTQVVPGERLSDILHTVININQLVASLARDLWLYQALGYVRFVRPGKVSSSTMPQKENPVDLENAEGQADTSTSLLIMAAYRLQHTRLQRDLSDSVVRRMVGQGLAHSFVATKRLGRALSSMKVERAAMLDDLKAHPEILAERAQIVRRLAGDVEGYENVRASVGRGSFSPGSDPASYLGDSVNLARRCRGTVDELLGLGGRRKRRGASSSASS
ncbi:MAG: adenylosuccinate lyase [Nitrososphaerota archaeon]|nr:adenylosuccinate lyase [Nitrososphaerota archaeon]MDG7025746.1 adenylosuccinate lyase [Nitrososphaerota archaeon]